MAGSKAKLAGFLALFCGLTAAGIWWASPPIDVVTRALRESTVLSVPAVVALVALAIGLIGAEMLRLSIFGRALGERVSVRAALDATIANNFFSWITPGSALGEPASTFMLGRHGVPWDAAVLISFAKFATSFVFILGAALVFVALGFGPPITNLVLVPLLTSIAIAVLLMLSLVVSAFAPETMKGHVESSAAWLSRRRLLAGPRRQKLVASAAGVFVRAIFRLAKFRQAGAPGWSAMLASHAIYYGVFVAILVVLANAFLAHSLVEMVPVAVIYQGFLYLAPTPGGAGLGEAAADVFFGDLLPGGAAIVVVVLFRSLTFYFHVALGFVYLGALGVLTTIIGRRNDEAENEEPRLGSS